MILKHFMFNPTPLNDLNQITSFLVIKTNLMTDSEVWIIARSSTIQATSMVAFIIALLFGTRDYVLPSRSTANLILSTLLYFSAGGPRWVILTSLILRLTVEYFLEKMGIDERADFKVCSITVATTVFLWIPATFDVLLQNYPIEESIHP